MGNDASLHSTIFSFLLSFFLFFSFPLQAVFATRTHASPRSGSIQSPFEAP